MLLLLLLLLLYRFLHTAFPIVFFYILRRTNSDTLNFGFCTSYMLSFLHMLGILL